jgi:hypothetical protein
MFSGHVGDSWRRLFLFLFLLLFLFCGQRSGGERLAGSLPLCFHARADLLPGGIHQRDVAAPFTLAGIDAGRFATAALALAGIFAGTAMIGMGSACSLTAASVDSGLALAFAIVKPATQMLLADGGNSSAAWFGFSTTPGRSSGDESGQRRGGKLVELTAIERSGHRRTPGDKANRWHKHENEDATPQTKSRRTSSP